MSLRGFLLVNIALILGLVLMLLPLASEGATIHNAEVGYFTETETGLDWLYLTHSFRESYWGAEIEAQDIDGGGWRRATMRELCDQLAYLDAELYGIGFDGGCAIALTLPQSDDAWANAPYIPSASAGDAYVFDTIQFWLDSFGFATAGLPDETWVPLRTEGNGATAAGLNLYWENEYVLVTPPAGWESVGPAREYGLQAYYPGGLPTRGSSGATFLVRRVIPEAGPGLMLLLGALGIALHRRS